MGFAMWCSAQSSHCELNYSIRNTDNDCSHLPHKKTEKDVSQTPGPRPHTKTESYIYRDSQYSVFLVNIGPGAIVYVCSSRNIQGICAMWDVRPKRILNKNLAKSNLPITYFAIAQFFRALWTNEIQREFKMPFGRISYIAQPPSNICCLASRVQRARALRPLKPVSMLSG